VAHLPHLPVVHLVEEFFILAAVITSPLVIFFLSPYIPASFVCLGVIFFSAIRFLLSTTAVVAFAFRHYLLTFFIGLYGVFPDDLLAEEDG
jgi:hypothetical protein